MQRQLSSWSQALQRFRIESSPTDEEVHSPAATWDEPDAALPDQRTVEDIREKLDIREKRAAAEIASLFLIMHEAQRDSGSDDLLEFCQIAIEYWSETIIRDRMDLEARQLEEQGEFRAAELLNRRSKALTKQLAEKVACCAELSGHSEAAEDVRAGRQPTSYLRSRLEATYSVRRRPAPADPGQLAATARLFSTAKTRGARIPPPLAPRADASRCWQLEMEETTDDQS